MPPNNPLFKYGFRKRTGNATIKDTEDYRVNIYNRADNMFTLIAYDKINGKKLKTTYGKANHITDIYDDARQLIKDEFGIDINDDKTCKKRVNPARKVKKPEKKPEPSKIDDYNKENFEPVFIEEEAIHMDPVLKDVDEYSPEVVFMAAPVSEDEYNPIPIEAFYDEKYEPIEMSYDVYGVDGITSDNIDTELAAKVQEREFQPLNAYPNFPFAQTSTSLPAIEKEINVVPESQEVSVELLDEVRDKEGKHIVEKEGYEAVNKFNMPKFSPIIIAALAFILGYWIFRNKIY